MLTNDDIRRIALAQSAEDLGCRPEDFLADENVTVMLSPGRNARKYLKLPITCNLVSYGNNIVAGVAPEVEETVRAYIGRYEFFHCFETPHMQWLNDRMMHMGHRVCFMAEYFLPDINKIPALTCDYELRLLKQEDFSELYLPEWSNALCEDRRHLDVLGVGAYDGEKLVGLCGCSADADQMRQIGVDVLPAYRRKGIASAMTSRLAVEILKRDLVPFYCAAWSNVRSKKNAIKSGFLPAWVEMTVKPAEVVEQMNSRTGDDALS